MTSEDFSESMRTRILYLQDHNNSSRDLCMPTTLEKDMKIVKSAIFNILVR